VENRVSILSTKTRIRASKCDVVLVHNFLQFASLIKLFNPSAIICLHMHDAWLSRFATKTSERRLRKVDLIIGVSDYITESTRKRFPAIADRCRTVYNSANTDRFCPSPDVTVPNAFQTEGSTITAVRR